MKKLPVSVCLIAGAEAGRIANALRSVADWASDMVVVINQEVGDGTEEIARSFGARTFREPWRGFIGQKNSVAEKAVQPWLLNLDADEVVGTELRTEIEGLFAAGEPADPAYDFPRCTFYWGRWIRHGDWYPDRVRRLWRAGSAVWTGVEPHARLEVQGRVGHLRSDLLHYSNESIARQISKIAPYHQEFVRQRRAEGLSAGVFELVVRPGWRFLRAYFFRLGFLDGWPGFYIAALSAFSTLTRYAMVREAGSAATAVPGPKT